MPNVRDSMPCLTRHWIALLTALLVCSCSTVSFYQQAIGGQLELSRKSRPNDQVLADPTVAQEVKRKLLLIEELRAFAARELHLPTKSFGKYCDLKRPYVVWVVFASPEFSVEAKTWWYPFVGSLKYRGFFDEKDAQREGDRLRKQGLDVFVGGVDAYSTLGYLRDPVLNTFLHRSDADLAELVFHELTHAKVFIPGDTDFNEAFATANAENGVRRWYRSKGDLSGLRAYEASLKKGREVIELLLRTREKLKGVYSYTYRSIETERQAKRQAFKAMLQEADQLRAKAGHSRYERAAVESWNNARLNTVATYYTMVPGFERLLKQHGGGLEDFYREVASMRKLNNEARMKILGSPR